MGQRLSPLDHLGSHVAGSLESTRTASDAASRVRARLAAGEPLRRSPDMRVRRSVIAGGALALAVAAAVLLLGLGGWQRNAPTTPLTFIVTAPGAKSESGVVGAFLAAPASSELPIAFSDGTSLNVGAGARARIAEVTPRGARVLVESGVVHANVVHRDDTRWLVDAGPFEVKVTGTRFDVAWQPADQALLVTLHEGSVVVTGCGLADGQRIVAGQQLRASCKSGTSTVGPITASPPTPEPQTTAATALPDAPASLPLAPAPAPASASASASASALASASSLASTSAPTLSASDLLTRANADRYAGHLDAATESLDTVRRRFHGSDAAATAAFELGRIAFDGRHDFPTAADWFDTYLRERPAGALAREALGRAIEARQRAGQSATAHDLATRYLTTYPDGPHATLARRITGGSP